MKDKPNNLVAKYARKYNKAAVHKDRKKAMKKGERKHKGNMDEKLSAKDDAGKWVTDFRKSDAPQFIGKSDEKKQKMAIAAYLSAKDDAKKEACWQGYTQKGMKKKGNKVVPNCVPEETNEDLRKWFGKGKKGDWVRVGTDGDIKGDCAREPGEGKPKCMPRDKAHSMSKKDRGSAARRKRAKDPTVDRPGTGNKPIMVKTDKKESVQESPASRKAHSTMFKSAAKKQHDSQAQAEREKRLKAKGWVRNDRGGFSKESIDEKNEPTNPKLWAKFKAQAKSKFDVYPSAYANGWAAKQYKAAGGGWKTTKEGFDVKANMVRSNDPTKFLKQANKAGDQNHKDTLAALKDIQKRKKMRQEGTNVQDVRYKKNTTAQLNPSDKHKMGKLADMMRKERGKSEMSKRMARGQRNDPVNKIRAKDPRESAQDRLSARADKHGLGKPNKAADDYMAKMKAKHGDKKVADMKAAGQAKIDAWRKAQQQKESVKENYRDLAMKGMGAEKKTDIKIGHDVDYFDLKDGSKHTGKIVKMGPTSYQVRDDQGGKISTFKYFDPVKARKLMKESTMNELTKRDMEMMAKRKQSNLVKRGKAKPAPKKTAKKKPEANINTVASKQGQDDNLIMQLRKAQDKKGKMKVKFRGGETELPLRLIDRLLATYDKAQRPQDKKKLVGMITHELRKRAGLKATGKAAASDKAMKAFQNRKGIPAPKGKGSKGPTNKELRDIERGK